MLVKNIFKDFAKWKMALVENSKPTYYSEEDGDSLVQIQFFKMDTVEGFPLRVRTFLFEKLI